MITHKFRLYPNKKIESLLLEKLNICRTAYNFFLGELNKQKVIDKSLIQGVIPDMKICDDKYKQVHSKSLQYEVYKLFSNLSGLSASKKKGRKVGSLRFKGKGVFKTFTYNQTGYKIDWCDKRNQLLWLSKIGTIPIRCHRKVIGIIKQITIKRFQSGKWYAFVIEDGYKQTKPVNDKVIGIDLGCDNIIFDSDNNSIKNPRILKKKEKKLKHFQRLMSKKQKGSNNRNRFRVNLSRVYESLTNSRNDFTHKISRYYANNYGVVAFEDMNISNLNKGNRLAKSLYDAVIGKIRQYTTYKVESTGGQVVLVDSRGTTQRCSQCGTIVKKELRDREHNCTFCGFVATRDYNSALEIKRLCLQKIGQGLSESIKHLEMGALLSNEQLLSMKNEATSSTSGVS